MIDAREQLGSILRKRARTSAKTTLTREYWSYGRSWEAIWVENWVENRRLPETMQASAAKSRGVRRSGGLVLESVFDLGAG
jgi:hypothetical protein